MRLRTLVCNPLSAAALAAVTLAASPPAAAAPPEPAAITWVRLPGAEGCIDADTLVQAAFRRLGERVGEPSGARRSIRGTVAPARDGATFRATWTLDGPDGAAIGTREIWTSSADCRAMDDDLTLVLALLIDPGASLDRLTTSESARPVPAPSRGVESPAAPRAAEAGPPASKPNAPLSSESEADTPPASPPAWSADMRGGPVFSIGFLPSVGVGGAARVVLQPPGFPAIEIGGVVWAEQRARGADEPFSAALRIVYGALAVCPLSGTWRGFTGALCGGLEAGAVHVSGFGASGVPARDVPIVNAALGARVRRTLFGLVFAGVGLDASVPLVRADLYYRKGGQDRDAFVAAPIAGALELSLGLDLR